MRFVVHGMRISDGETVSMIIEAARPDEAIDKAALRGVDAQSVKQVPEPATPAAHAPLGVAGEPAMAPHQPPTIDRALAGATANVSGSVASRGGVLVLMLCIVEYFALRALPSHAGAADRWFRGVVVAAIGLVPILLSFYFTSNMAAGHLWAAICCIVLPALVTIVVGLFGLAVTQAATSLPPIILMLILLVLTAAPIVYSALAIGPLTRMRESQQRGFEVTPSPPASN